MCLCATVLVFYVLLAFWGGSMFVSLRVCVCVCVCVFACVCVLLCVCVVV